MKGSYILSLESSFNKMYEMGKCLLHDKRIETPEDVMKQINEVDMDSVIRVIDKYMDWKHLNVSYVGNVKNKVAFEKELASILFEGEMV